MLSGQSRGLLGAEHSFRTAKKGCQHLTFDPNLRWPSRSKCKKKVGPDRVLYQKFTLVWEVKREDTPMISFIKYCEDEATIFCTIEKRRGPSVSCTLLIFFIHQYINESILKRFSKDQFRKVYYDGQNYPSWWSQPNPANSGQETHFAHLIVRLSYYVFHKNCS